jgi:hypothetical protein
VIRDVVTISILTACISNTIRIGIFLILVLDHRTVIAYISHLVSISIVLIRVRNSWTVVLLVEDSITIRIPITGVSSTVSIGVLLARVGEGGAVVRDEQGAGGVIPVVWEAVSIGVKQAAEAVSSEARLADAVRWSSHAPTGHS